MSITRQASGMSFAAQARLHRRAAAVAHELDNIQATLNTLNPEWFQKASPKEQAETLLDLYARDDAGFKLEFDLRAQPIDGGAR